MRKLNKRWLWYGLAIGLCLALVACAGSDDAGAPEQEVPQDDGTESEATEGGDLVAAMSADIVSLDPHGSNDNPSSKVRSLVYETLVYQDENMDLHPGLAESYDRIDDLTWEFQLREGVTFHDGTELNAEAVKATLERVLDPDLASQRAFLFDMIEEIEVIDDYTVRITTAYPFAPLPAHLAHDAGGIISLQAIEEAENGERNLDLEPVGTGPFKIDVWKQGSEITLVKNEAYWGEAANLDSVTLKVVPEQLTRIGMLENGEAHIADRLEPANAERVENTDGVHLVAQPSLSLTYVGFNVEKEPFDDVRVRQAISMAIDTEVINEGIYEGYGTPAKGPINELVFGYKDDLEGLPYDPERAQELLAEAGYADGFSTTIWTNDDNPTRVQTAEYIQDQLSEIGIDVEIELVEWGAFLDATAEGEHDMFVLGWVTVTGDADYGMYSLFHSSNFGAPGNRSFYANDEVDEKLSQAREESDEQTRLELYHDVQEILVEEAPMIYTVFDDFRVGVSDQVEGFIQHPNGLFLLKDVTLTGESAGY